MMWWVGRPSHRTTVTDSDTAVGNVWWLGRPTLLNTICDSESALGNAVVFRTALAALQ